MSTVFSFCVFKILKKEKDESKKEWKNDEIEQFVDS